MPSVLGAISGLSQGFTQGQDQLQVLKSKALAVQQAQMQIDQAKRQLAADAAAFSGMQPLSGLSGGAQSQPGGPQPPPTSGQPPMPGQSSQPSQPAGQVMQASPMPGTLPPQAPQGGGPSAPGGGAAPASPAAGGDGAVGTNDPYALIMRVAQDIKRRNPNIDGPTLALAVDRIMGLVAPQLRQQTQIITEQMRAATSQANTQARDETSIANTQARDQTSQANTGARVAATERGQDIGLQKAQAQIGAALQRVQVTQAAIDRRFASGQGNKIRLAAQSNRAKEIMTDLTTAQRQVSSLNSALVPADDPRMKAAIDKVNRAQAKLDILEKSVQQDGGGAAPVAPTGAGGNSGWSATPVP